MRRYILKALRLLALILIPATITFGAQAAAVNIFPACNGSAGKTDVCQNIDKPGQAGTNPIITGLKVAITILSIIVGIIAVIMIIIAGLSFITANGDAQAIARARSSIIYALVGIVIVALAQTLVVFILNKL